MVFVIKNRVHRTQANVVGIRQTQHRENLAKATEAASVVVYPLFLNGNATADTFRLGYTPTVGAKGYELFIKCATAGTNDGTVDVLVDGTSIITGGAVTLNNNTLKTPTLTAAALAAIAGAKEVTVVTTIGATPPTDVVVSLHLKTVDNQTD